MGGLPWFRLYVDFATDPKVQSLPEKLQRRLVMVFCLKSSGELEALTDEEISVYFRIPVKEVKATKSVFIQKGFLESGENWVLSNWEKRQYKSDNSTSRVQKFRLKQTGNVSETPSDADIDKDADEDKKPKSKATRIKVSEINAIVDLYHRTLPILPSVRQPLSDNSRSNLIKRANDVGTGTKTWLDFFNSVKSSEFLTGQKTDWKANFHWLVRPKNFEKVLNGEYENATKGEELSEVKLFCSKLDNGFRSHKTWLKNYVKGKPYDKSCPDCGAKGLSHHQYSIKVSELKKQREFDEIHNTGISPDAVFELANKIGRG